jgi:hypothetical protein
MTTLLTHGQDSLALRNHLEESQGPMLVRGIFLSISLAIDSTGHISTYTANFASWPHTSCYGILIGENKHVKQGVSCGVFT